MLQRIGRKIYENITGTLRFKFQRQYNKLNHRYMPFSIGGSIMNNKFIIIFLFIMVILPSQVSAATITPLISYQGKLLDSASAPVSSTANMTFRLYDFQTGGSSLWSETKNVQVTNGIFNTYLGDTAPLPVTQFNSALWLEIVVDGETLTPRQQLSGSPYAFSLAPGAVISNITHNHDSRYSQKKIQKKIFRIQKRLISTIV